MTVFKPMLATSFDTIEELVERCEALYKKQGFINYAIQDKYDGIRAITSGGKLYSRTGKLIPNKYIQQKFSHLEDGLDGELHAPLVNFNAIQSVVMTSDWAGNITEEDYISEDFYGLSHSDYLTLESNIRYELFDSINRPFKTKDLRFYNKPPTVDFLQNELDCSLECGYEGIMFRNLDAPYKHGRSSKTKLELVKIKAFKDKEGICIGINQEVNKHGEPKDSMGSLQMDSWDTLYGFKIGTGFDAKFRKDVWENKDLVIGKKITYKYQELSSYGIPRFPVFMRIREED